LDGLVKGEGMRAIPVPKEVPNWIGGQQPPARRGGLLEKRNPSDGTLLYHVARSSAPDVRAAVEAACEAKSGWAATPAVRRGQILHEVAMELKASREKVARVVALETGKSLTDALAETDGAIALGIFMAGEGQRLYGRTTTSGVPNKLAMTIRQPVGVAGLIIAANTPIANVAWKVFPALICGNAAVLKAAEDAPATAWLFAQLAHEAELPLGVLNVVQGLGPEAGAALVNDPDVGVISFTGSTKVGREVAVSAGRRLAKVSLELGGKNPFIVCDDADLEEAVRWAALSAYSNAGQRCAAGSRLIIFDSVYERFRAELTDRTRSLRIGHENGDTNGARILAGGHRLTDADHKDGFYMAPTLIDNADPDDEISTTELFGPIACLYRVRDFAEALELANRSPYGLTAAIHTRNLDRALEFTQRVEAGVAVVNAGTYGSEPHMPFGGLKQSGNGFREPGTEALDVYSELKDVYITIDPGRL
jgi:aldehyde dehydrogenase (NAD+)